MARSVILRTFDDGVVQRLKNQMVHDFGMDCREGYLPASITKREDGRLDVAIKRTATGEIVATETYDTVL